MQDKILLEMVDKTIKNVINEMVSPVVWHFCWLDNLISILQNNQFQLSKSGVDRDKNPGITGYSNKRQYYMCTTRSKNSKDGYSNIVSNDNQDGYARLTLDGDMLNSVVHAKASDYFGNRSNNEEDLDGKRLFYKDIENKNFQDLKTDNKYNEKEDTIWYNKPILPNANKYIKRIDVFVPLKRVEKEGKIKTIIPNYKTFIAISRKASELNIPIFFYYSSKDFNMQTENTLNQYIK